MKSLPATLYGRLAAVPRGNASVPGVRLYRSITTRFQDLFCTGPAMQSPCKSQPRYLHSLLSSQVFLSVLFWQVSPASGYDLAVAACSRGQSQTTKLHCAATSNKEQDPTAPSAAETARTILDLSDSGTLCTSQLDGIPLGTYTSYVLDQQGQPILRLRADAVHTANLSREPRCSLFVQPSSHPARLLARATLIGVAEPADEVGKIFAFFPTFFFAHSS